MKVKDRISLIVPWGPIGGIFFCVIILLCGMFPGEVLAEGRTEEPGELHALSATLLDGDTGRVLYGKEDEVKRANASTTKILTCILALEQCDLDEMVDVSAYAASMPNVQLGIEEGECYAMKDLLYSLMLESHNDVAVAVAEHMGGNVESFAVMMNEKAKEIGCQNTQFFTPNGLDYKDGENFHGTTSTDLAKIMSYCVWQSPKREEFLTITQTRQYSFTNYEKKKNGEYTMGNRNFQCGNHNSYLNQNPQCISGKTGFTGEAGYCYVGAVESEGRHFVVALLGCGWPNNKNYKWEDCNRLFLYGTNHFHFRKIPDFSRELEDVTLLEGANKSYSFGQEMKLSPFVEHCTGKVLLADWETLDITTKYPKEFVANKKGEVSIGYLQVSVGNHRIMKRKIRVECPVPKRNLAWYFQGIMQVWSICSVGN
ncbi:MAG: D-alanyl-D-alanine carboxypeptidase [Lachnospiraceae bacterium]|nr:D-alanyl-D-alanine carboxypeptidase [Lachnospiraceae bacterium]